MNLINRRLKKRSSNKFLRRKLAVSLNDANFQNFFEVPDFNQKYKFGLSFLGDEDSDTFSEELDEFLENDDGNKIFDYLKNMSSNEERLQALIALGVYDKDEEIDLENDYFWDDGEIIDYNILPALSKCLHNNTLPTIWKGLIPQLTKSYFAADWGGSGNCYISENEFHELKRCWEKVPAVVDEVIQYIKDNNIKYEDWDNVYSSIEAFADSKLAAISSSNIWDHYLNMVSSNLGYYIRDYLKNNANT